MTAVGVGRPTVALAHEDGLVADILTAACETRGVATVARYRSARELARHGPASSDVLILALQLHACSAEDQLRGLLRAGIRVIVFGPVADADRLLALLTNGAHGCVSDDATPDEVATTVEVVARGGIALDGALATVLVERWRRLREESSSGPGRPTTRGLTERERDVLAALVDGLTTKAAARTLGMAVKTVENHKIRIFDKLGVRTQTQAVTIAMTRGLLDESDARRPAPPA
jgi:DNA-binding NarL/FixJ family response regulator